VKVIVIGGVGDLRDDLLRISKEAPVALRAVVSEGIKAGNTEAKALATVTSRAHARKYPGTFTAEMRPTYHFGSGNIYSGEYGPNARGQGLLAGILENGSRNNPAHLNLSRSLDLIGPQFPREVGAAVDGLFW
jgi:hypothetical protein